MESDDRLLFEISELVTKAFDKSICDEGFNRLQHLISTNPKALEYYFDIISVFSCLDNTKEFDIGVNATKQGSQSDLTEAANSGSQVCDDSNLALRGVDAQALLSDVDDHDPSEDSEMAQDMLEILEWEETSPAVEVPKEEIAEETDPVIHPARKKRPVSKFQIFTLVTGAAAMIFFALFIKFAPVPLPSIEVATLVDQMNVQWGDSAVDLENGERLLSNDYPLNLEKGLVSIAYDQGVDVVVEGPALFEIERSGVFLEYGRLYSQVSETGTGFTVNTSTSQFVDMGTEFGVKAEIDGSSELHVTKGKVQLFAGAKGKSKISRMVTENKAVQYNAKSGLVKDIRVKKNAFVRKINSAFNQVWMGPSPYERAVLKTGPSYYWRFDGDQQGLLRDELNPRSNDEYKLFGSLSYSDGPDLGAGKNVALRLTGSEDDYAILREVTDETDNADGFSIAMWIRPEKVDSDFRKNVIMRFKAVGIDGVGARRSLGFDDENRFYFNALSNEDAVQKEYRERISIRSNPVAVNTWHHLVVTHTSGDRVNLYVDGELQATQEILSSLEPANENSQWCVGSATIESEYSESHTSFEGSIDEISHYDRELSAEEVEMLQAAVGQK